MAQEGPQRLDEDTARGLRAPETLDDLTWEGAQALCSRQEGMDRFRPDGYYGRDPRSDEMTVFNESRARRPHDNAPRKSGSQAESCVICEGRTTQIIDQAALSEGFTFINENLFPVFHPAPPQTPELPEPTTDGTLMGRSIGLHFVQWTSSRHDVDWPDLNAPDRRVVLDRLAALEQRLLALPGFPPGERFVSIIKNSGRLVGGSMDHPHQQIALSNVMPRRVRENQAFQNGHHTTFSGHMLRDNPAALTVADLDTGRFLVPYFMRRPYNLLYLVKDVEPRHLHELSGRQRDDLAGAIATGMNLSLAALDLVGREAAFNIVFHTGPGAGIYLEFLPRTQQEGGFEQLGLSACQSSPYLAAEALRGAM